MTDTGDRTTGIDVTADGVVLRPAPAYDMAVRVELAGRRIWSTRTGRGSVIGDALLLAWPSSLIPWLDGWCDFTVVLREADGTETAFSKRTRLGEGNQEVTLVDPISGQALVVNKWGRVAKSFEVGSAEFFERMLTSAGRITDLVAAGLGIDLFVTGGSLLGPVRDGHLIPTDDDVDLAHFLADANPSDAVLESFRIERFLRSHGYEVIRHSAAHMQVMFPGGTAYDEWYVDIFTYFTTSGWFHGPFHIRVPAQDVNLLPYGEIDVHGHMFKAPADVDSMLAANYGPSWRTPDPSFRFDTPEDTSRRFYWWLNHFDADREDWENWWRRESRGVNDGPSAFHRWMRTNRSKDSALYDIGCGDGATVVALAETGDWGAFFASDHARPALVAARERARGEGVDVDVFRANQYSVRETTDALARVCHAWSGPVDIVTEGLFESLHFLGWDCTMQEMRVLLRRGGRAFIRVDAGCGSRDRSQDPRLAREWDEEGFLGQLRSFGLSVDASERHGEKGDDRWFMLSLSE